MKGMSWLCPHQAGELCKKMEKICEPGMKGCVLHGRVEFVEPEKETKGGKMREKIEKALNDIRPALQMDGGDIQLVSIDDVVAI